METLDAPKVALEKSSFFLNRHFAWLWMGQTVSNLGSWITSNGFALTAVLILHATTFQMGLLAALGSVPVIVFGLLAGVWIDRLPRKRLLILADLGRTLLLLLIPLAALSGLLRIELLYVVIVLVGTLTVFFEIAHKSFLPALIDREQLAEGNSKLEASSALAEIAGPSLSGLLIQAITAPFAIIFDALSFLFSAFCIGMIRVQEPANPPMERSQSIWREMWEGLQVLWHDGRLRALAISAGMRNFFGGAFATLYTFYVVRDLGVTPLVYGILVTMGGAGALLGALVAPWAARRFGLSKLLIASLLIDGCMTLCTPLAAGPALAVVTMLIVSQLVGDCGAALHSVNEVSLRQTVVPERFLGRVNASMHFIGTALGPIGAMLAGLCSELVGTRPTLFIGAIGVLCSFVFLLFSPVRTLE
ncbi:MFS transporter [Reticulibacter mediterranei]|uniref:MFS transporter n=1 Tax=Reticulibacter mediterranei TaxID=2778369 RepID=A0A8J3IRW3_9CHLR|nr:MFS transporter [Reticulibacter mediterranei]GHO95760.1 MFS transporter [Reticulibacter mediterranei]